MVGLLRCFETPEAYHLVFEEGEAWSEDLPSLLGNGWNLRFRTGFYLIVSLVLIPTRHSIHPSENPAVFHLSIPPRTLFSENESAKASQ